MEILPTNRVYVWHKNNIHYVWRMGWVGVYGFNCCQLRLLWIEKPIEHVIEPYIHLLHLWLIYTARLLVFCALKVNRMPDRLTIQNGQQSWIMNGITRQLLHKMWIWVKFIKKYGKQEDLNGCELKLESQPRFISPIEREYARTKKKFNHEKRNVWMRKSRKRFPSINFHSRVFFFSPRKRDA